MIDHAYAVPAFNYMALKVNLHTNKLSLFYKNGCARAITRRRVKKKCHDGNM